MCSCRNVLSGNVEEVNGANLPQVPVVREVPFGGLYWVQHFSLNIFRARTEIMYVDGNLLIPDKVGIIAFFATC